MSKASRRDFEPEADLGRGRGLAGALQPDHEDRNRRRRIEIEPDTFGAQHLHQMIVNDLHHHLPGRDAFQHRFADRLVLDLSDEVLDHRQRHVGLEQRHANLAQRSIDIRLAESAAPRQPIEDVAEPLAKVLEHGPSEIPQSAAAQHERARARYSRTGGAPWGHIVLIPL
jgi:hypothetical protein